MKVFLPNIPNEHPRRFGISLWEFLSILALGFLLADIGLKFLGA